MSENIYEILRKSGERLFFMYNPGLKGIQMKRILFRYIFCFSGIHRNLNAVTAVGFAISMIACFLVFIGESLQYFSVFMILFTVLLLILYIPWFRAPSNSALLLFAAGMITNFFDMLTAPLLTLGIPLVLILCLFIMNSDTHSFINRIWLIISHSLAWGIGYALCWISKWGIGTLATGSNIFEDAMKTAKFRVEGSESIPLDRSLMFRLNFDTYFFSKGHKPAVFILLLILILILFLIRHHRSDWKETVLTFLLISAFPYVWFFVFANHSQLHYFYTYRIQAISLFSVFAALGCGLDMTKKGQNPQI